MKKHQIFNGDLLRYKSLEDYASFKDMYDFAKNKDAIKCHLESYKFVAIEPSRHDEGSDNTLRESMSSGIRAALNHFGGLTIVSLCATYEMAAREFLTSFFNTNPSHIYEFIGPDDAKGHVSLKEVLKVDSYQDLLDSLSRKAASVASKGKYGQVLSRIASLCKESVDNNLIKKLDRIQGERNKLVHEKYSKQWELADIQEAEETVSAVIEQICHYGINSNIPGKYTCVTNENTMVLQSIALLTKSSTTLVPRSDALTRAS